MQIPQAVPVLSSGSHSEFHTALRAFTAGPANLQDAVHGLDRNQLGARPIRGKWSIQEIVFHVADAEVVGAERMRRLLAEPGTGIRPFDQDQWVDVFGYNERPLEELQAAMQLFTALRADSSRLFRNAGDEDLAKFLDHPQYGRLSLSGILSLYSRHCDRHVEQIHERRALLGTNLESRPAVLSYQQI